MGKRQRIGLAAASVVLTMVVAANIANYCSEPHFQGKSLSDWVVIMRDGPDREKGRQVVHLLGPSCTPLLLQWLQREDRSTLKGTLHNLGPNVEGWLIARRIMKARSMTSYYDAKYSYRALGFLAFEELGPEGKAAIPTLIDRLGHRDPKTGQMSIVAGSAWLILPHMAPDSIGPLVRALTNRDLQVRALAVGALGKIGTNANIAIPRVQPFLEDENIGIRMNACASLGQLGVDPAEFMPVLISCLPETNFIGTNFDILDYDLEVMVKYKTRARPAVPVLLQILANTSDDNRNPTNTMVRGVVTDALREIAPETVPPKPE
jgi:HEAT repeats